MGFSTDPLRFFVVRRTASLTSFTSTAIPVSVNIAVDDKKFCRGRLYVEGRQRRIAAVGFGQGFF